MQPAGFFNFRTTTNPTPAAFRRRWWQVYGGDPFWTPPYYPALGWAWDPARNPHLARLSPVRFEVEALPRRRARQQTLGDDLMIAPQLAAQPMIETSVATAMGLIDPRRTDGTAYLAALHVRNDAESLGVLMDAVYAWAYASGARRLLGPVGVSPHLGSGLPQDHWNEASPVDVGDGQPYVPELLRQEMTPGETASLYHLAVPAGAVADGLARIELLDVARLSADLLPMLADGLPDWGGFPAPDRAEAAFLLRWLRLWPLVGLVARVDGETIGFVVAQADMGPWLRWTRGGRWPWRRPELWLGRYLQTSRVGRVVLGGVRHDWRGKGVGGQLLGGLQAQARRVGWRSLVFGPLPAAGPGAMWLVRQGAARGQQQRLYYQMLD